MLKVGLTGGIGSGKTTVTDYFSSYGVNIIDADVIAREAVKRHSPCLKAIAEHFGSTILLSNGELNRAALRARIFNHAEEKEWLESLIHPEVRKQIVSQLATSTGPYCILSSPLLIETKQTSLVNRVAIVDLPEEIQLERAASRDGVDQNQIQNIINAQTPRPERLAFADDIIDNSHSLAATKARVAELHQFYLTL